MHPIKKILDKKLLRQIVVSFGFRIITPFIMLVTTPALLYNLGYQDYGLWTLLITTLGWLTICDFGITNQVRNESKYLIIENRKTDASILFTTASVFSFLLIVTFVVLISVLHINYIYKVFLSLVFLFIIQANICRAICLSLDKPEFATAITNVPNLFMLFFIVLNSSFDIKDIMIAYASGCFVMFFLGYFLIHKNGVVLSILALNLKVIKRTMISHSILKGGGAFFLVQLVSMGLILSDRYIISLTFGNEAVSKYDVIFKVANFCLMFFSIINTVLWTKFTELWIKKDLGKIRRIFRAFDMIALLLFIILALTLAHIDFIIKLWLNVNDMNYSVFYISSIIIYLLGFYLMSAYSSFLSGISHIKSQFIIQLVVLIMKVLCIAFLIFTSSFDKVEYYIFIGSGCLLLAGLLLRRQAYAQTHS